MRSTDEHHLNAEKCAHDLMQRFCQSSNSLTLRDHTKVATFSKTTIAYAQAQIEPLQSRIAALGGDDFYNQTSREYRKYNHDYYYLNYSLMLCACITGQQQLKQDAFLACQNFPKRTSACETEHLKHDLDLFGFPDETKTDVTPQLPKTPALAGPLSHKELTASTGLTSTQCQEALAKMDDDQLNRYFIDPYQQHWPNYSAAKQWEKREPGSTTAMRLAIRTQLLSSAPLSVDWIRQCHRLAATNVSGLSGSQTWGIDPIRPGEWRTVAVKFYFRHFNNASEAGIMHCKTFIKQIQAILGKSLYELEIHGHSKPYRGTPRSAAKWTARAPKAGDIEKCINAVIATYQHEIAAAKSACPIDTKALIASCIKLAQAINLIHPFRDANLRVAGQVLNKTLLDNDLPMTILRAPTLLEAYSTHEQVHAVMQGMHYFKHFVTTGYFPTTEPQAFETENITRSLISDAEFVALDRDCRLLMHANKNKLPNLIDNQVITAAIVKSNQFHTLDACFEHACAIQQFKHIDTDTTDALESFLLSATPAKIDHLLMRDSYQVVNSLKKLSKSFAWFLSLSEQQQQTIQREYTQISDLIDHGYADNADDYLSWDPVKQELAKHLYYSDYWSSHPDLNAIERLTPKEQELLLPICLYIARNDRKARDLLKQLIQSDNKETKADTSQAITLTQYCRIDSSIRSWIIHNTDTLKQALNRGFSPDALLSYSLAQIKAACTTKQTPSLFASHASTPANESNGNLSHKAQSARFN